MSTEEGFKLAGQYGVGGILAAIIGWIMYKIGMRLISAIDKQTERIDEHTKADVSALTALTLRIERMETHLETKLDGFVDRVEDWLDRTPVEGQPPTRPRPRPPIQGSQPLPTTRTATGEYHVRAKSEPGGTKRG